MQIVTRYREWKERRRRRKMAIKVLKDLRSLKSQIRQIQIWIETNRLLIEKGFEPWASDYKVAMQTLAEVRAMVLRAEVEFKKVRRQARCVA